MLCVDGLVSTCDMFVLKITIYESDKDKEETKPLWTVDILVMARASPQGLLNIQCVCAEMNPCLTFINMSSYSYCKVAGCLFI